MNAIADALRALLDRNNGQEAATLAATWDNARAALAAHDAAVNAGGWGPANYGDGGIGPYGTPWRFVRDADGSVVAYVEGSREAATARRDRIVACVNACAGIADPAAAIAALRAIAEYAPGGELDSGWIYDTASEGLK